MIFMVNVNVKSIMLIFIILNIPFISWFTLEIWAVQNATKATEALIDVYSVQR